MHQNEVNWMKQDADSEPVHQESCPLGNELHLNKAVQF